MGKHPKLEAGKQEKPVAKETLLFEEGFLVKNRIVLGTKVSNG